MNILHFTKPHNVRRLENEIRAAFPLLSVTIESTGDKTFTIHAPGVFDTGKLGTVVAKHAPGAPDSPLNRISVILDAADTDADKLLAIKQLVDALPASVAVVAEPTPAPPDHSETITATDWSAAHGR